MLRISNEVTNAQIIAMFTSSESTEITGLHNRKLIEKYFEIRLDLWYERFILGFDPGAVEMEKVKAFDHESLKMYFLTLARSLFRNSNETTVHNGVFVYQIEEQVQRAHKNLVDYRSFHKRVSTVRGAFNLSRIIMLGFYLSLNPDSISLAEAKQERMRVQTNERVARLRAKRKEQLESNPLHKQMTQAAALRRAEAIVAAARHKAESIALQSRNLRSKIDTLEAQLKSLEVKQRAADGNLRSALVYLEELRLSQDTKEKWIESEFGEIVAAGFDDEDMEDSGNGNTVTLTLPQDLIDSDASSDSGTPKDAEDYINMQIGVC